MNSTAVAITLDLNRWYIVVIIGCILAASLAIIISGLKAIVKTFVDGLKKSGATVKGVRFGSSKPEESPDAPNYPEVVLHVYSDLSIVFDTLFVILEGQHVQYEALLGQKMNGQLTAAISNNERARQKIQKHLTATRIRGGAE